MPSQKQNQKDDKGEQVQTPVPREPRSDPRAEHPDPRPDPRVRRPVPNREVDTRMPPDDQRPL